MVPNMDMTELESIWRRQAPSAKTLRRQASPCSFRRWCWPSSCLIRTARSPFTQRPTNWWRKAGLAKRGGRERGHHLRRESRKRTGKQEAFAHLRPGSSLRLISCLKRERGREEEACGRPQVPSRMPSMWAAGDCPIDLESAACSAWCMLQRCTGLAAGTVRPLARKNNHRQVKCFDCGALLERTKSTGAVAHARQNITESLTKQLLAP